MVPCHRGTIDRALLALGALLLLSLLGARPAAALNVAPTGPTEIISAGWDHTCALMPGGAVECWGRNGDGQAGSHAGPYSQVSAGAYHTCALTPGGAVECWGRNVYGQAGNHAGPYSQVSAGASHTCALTPAGAVECWGRNVEGQAGTHTGPYNRVSAGSAHTCALTPAGAVECWGDNIYGQGGSHAGPYSQVSAGGLHTCALTPAGAVECWGDNYYGQAGNHTGPYSQVSAGIYHACALTPAGAVECWGDNFYGQAGTHAGPYSQVSAGWDHTCALTPAGAIECRGYNGFGQAGTHAGPYGPYRPPQLPEVLSAGGLHTCALTPAGTVECWGDNIYGQAGNHAGPYSQVSAGGHHTCALTPVGAVECWGWDFYSQAGNHAGPYGQVSAGLYHTCALTPAGAVECWGDNVDGQAGDHAGPYSQVSAGAYHTCALTPAGAVVCWGLNGDGQAGSHAGPYSQVSAGGYHTCALTPAGAVECWGRNGDGQAGSHAGPYSRVSAGSAHTCALTPAGAVECWGRNLEGQAGSHAGPYSQVSAGDSHTCALTPGGAVECWGYNAYGQAGNHAGPYGLYHPPPPEVLSAGGHHTCALTPAGAVECWGYNTNGQAGSHAGPYSQVSAGSLHTCALTPVGAVECWGRNVEGQAGSHAGPYSQVSAGDSHTCALTPAGAVECWGRNGDGQAGNHAGTFVQVSAGYGHTCALTPVGAVECWGDSDFGQAGNHAGPYSQVSAGEHHTCALTPGGAVECWGINGNGEAGNHAGPYTQVDAGDYHTCALTPGGAVECWGDSDFGQAGDHAGPYSQVSAGRYHTCALTPAGAVECWGYNGDGQAGNHAGPYGPYVPQTTITAAPPALTNSNDPSFEFTNPDTAATFECRLDSGAWGVCSSPKSYTDLADGSHTFEVRVVSSPGNPDANPAAHTWTIDTVAPTATITNAPPSLMDDPVSTFAFSGDDGSGSGVASFRCSLDGGALTQCASPQTYTNLADGSHTFEVRAVDNAGNVSPADSHTWTIDTNTPDTTITAAPADPTNSNAASFSFSSTEPGGSFTCQLDSQPAAACTSPTSYTGLADGPHTFTVFATDAAGNADPSPAGHTWTIDTSGPDTTINSGPSGVTGDNDPAFGFSSETGATFECQLDSEPFIPCDSPQGYGDLGDGPHTFRVRATDAAGNTGPTAERAFTVDSAAPSVSIDTHPPALTNNNDPSFTFSGESGATLECRLETSPFEPCASPISFTNLADGEHTFTVQATDAAGNSAEAAYTWTIDTTPPDTTITAAPNDPTNSNDPSFSFSSTEPGSSFTCQLDGGTAAPCASPQSYTGLSDGSHTFTVFATDAAGNADASAASHTWTIDTAAPSVTINQASGQADPTGSSPINFTVVFSEAVSGFATGDVTLSGSAGATTATVSGGPTTYNVAVSGMTGSSTVIATVAANRAEDAAGNDNAASTSTDNQVTYNAPAPFVLYVTAAGGSVPGAGAYQKNDILKWNGSAWSVWFNGATRGLPAAADIMAFDVANEATGAAWLAIRQAVKLPGLGKLQPTQIAYSNGASWSLFFDGGDVGLKTTGERVDGLEVLPGSVSPIGSGCQYYLLISTVAGGGVPVDNTNVSFTGEDVLGFCMTQSGANTAGQWHVVFEGESQGLAKNNNYGLSASDDATTLYFTAKKAFTGDGGLVKPSELFSFSGGAFSGPLWKAKDHGLNQVVDGIDVVGSIP